MLTGVYTHDLISGEMAIFQQQLRRLNLFFVFGLQQILDN
jgi:hypothetical protein